jgi:PAS domain S-box-containing protein
MNAKREAFRKRARQNGLKGFLITEQERQGVMVRARQRPKCFPVYYLEPLKGNKAALGFDLFSDPVRRSILQRSRDSGQILATRRITLVQERSNQFGFLVFAPVYSEKAQTVGQRRQNLRGFVLGVYRAGEIMKAAMRSNSQLLKGIELELWDKTAAEMLHIRSLPSKSNLVENMSYEESFKFAGRSLQLSVRPGKQFVANRSNWQPWLPYVSSVAGLLFTVLAFFYVYKKYSELYESRLGSSVLMENAAQGILITDGKGVIQNVNKQIEHMFGYADQELLGETVEILIPEGQQEAHIAHRTKFIKCPQQRMMRTGQGLFGRRKSGECFPAEIGLGYVQFRGKMRIMAFISDITARKIAEKELVSAKEEAETANRLKSDFLNMMSHELRTPLTTMLGNLPYAGNQLSKLQKWFEQSGKDPGIDLEDISSALQDCESDSQHLLALINDLLDISKIEAGRLELKPEELLLQELAETTTEKMRRQAESKNLSLEVIAEDDPLVRADALRLRQILLNLLSNALKFTDQGGIIVRISSEQKTALLTVEDSGSGISKADQPYIFDKFRQADSSFSRAAGGTGLGLAISKRLVELHKGRIEVKSDVGKGSTFSLVLPLIENRDI